MRKPGDRMVRRPLIRHPHLKRVLGIPALFSVGYGDVGSSIYYALGIVALVALGATPIVLMIAGIIYVLNALTYAEGTAMFPESGGSSSFARHAFNDLIGFLAGWSLMLSYVITISLSAFTIPPYLGFFVSSLRESPIAGTAFSMGVILFLMYLNVVGIKESSRMNIFFITIDIVTQLSLVVLGILVILWPKPAVLTEHMFGAGNWPSAGNLIYGIALAALAFTGVETISQMSEEAQKPRKKAPAAYIMMIFVVLIIFAGISLTALSAMTPQELGDPINGWARDPVAGIAAHLPNPLLQKFFGPLVAILAASILLSASNAGMIGASRLAFSLGRHQQLPEPISRIHKRHRTPYIAITLFSLAALVILAQGFFPDKFKNFFALLGSIYAFGSLLTFALAHASIIGLRMKQPGKQRPFKLPLNVKIKKREVPLTAIFGLAATSTVLLIIIIIEPYARYGGLAWMLLGLVIYAVYRWQKRLPLTQTPEAPKGWI